MQRSGPPPSHPVDHGWAWLVCLGALVANFITMGGTRSVGIILLELILHFDAQPGVAALAIGLSMAGFTLFSGIGNGLGVVLTNRTVALAGAVCSFISMVITAYAPNIIVVIVFFGFFSGIGRGFLFGPSLVTLGHYFNKRRSLANGLALAGGCLGNLVLPLFLNAAVEEYGFQGAFLIYAGFILHAIPGSLLLRPPQFYNRDKRSMTSEGTLDYDELDMKGEKNNASFKEDLVEDHNQCPQRTTPDMHGSACSLNYVHLQNAPDLVMTFVKDTGTQTRAAPTWPHVGAICRHILSSLVDKNLLTNPVFLLMVIGFGIGQSGFSNIVILMPAYCFEFFNSKQTGALLISIIGISDLTGRILGGWFSDQGLISRPMIMCWSFILCGLLSILVPFFPSFPVLVTYAVVFGLLGGTFLALMAVIVVDLLGIFLLPAGLGTAILIAGLSSMPLPTTMGVIQRAAGTTTVPIRVCGALMILGGVLFAFIPCAQARWRRGGRPRQLPQAPGATKRDVGVQVKPADLLHQTQAGEKC